MELSYEWVWIDPVQTDNSGDEGARRKLKNLIYLICQPVAKTYPSLCLTAKP